MLTRKLSSSFCCVLLCTFLVAGILLVEVQATTKFSDGFETGNFNAWTGTLGGAIAVTTNKPHNGAYSMEATGLGSVGTWNCSIYKNLGSSYADLYMRAYVAVNSTPATAGFYCMGIIMGGDNYVGGRAVAVPIFDPNTNKWGVDVWSGSAPGALYYESGTSTLNANQYYCVEIYAHVASSPNGVVTLWIDDVQKLTQTGIATNGPGNIQYPAVGVYYIWDAYSSPQTMYVDYVVVATTYIGTNPTLFSDGFESGNLSAWSGTSGSPSTFGDITVEADTNLGNGQIDLCKFQFTDVTGTYTGSVTVYLSAVLSAPDNKVVVGIYDVIDGSQVVSSAEKTNTAVGWNSLTLIGSFSLTYNNWYWLVWHGPLGTDGRSAVGAISGQHGWKTRAYDGTLPDPITGLDDTSQEKCSIYFSYGVSVVTQPHSGSYSMHSGEYAPGTWAYAAKSLDVTYSELWLRSYVYLVALPAAGDKGSLSALTPPSPPGLVYSTIGRTVDGQLQWGLINNVASVAYTYNDSSIKSGWWYCIEIHAFVNSSSTGVMDLWINGTNIIHQTGQNLGTNPLGRIIVGGGGETGLSPENYQDNVVVADYYIPPETPTVNQFAASSTVYAYNYTSINCTISRARGNADFANATVTLTGSVSLFWDNTTSTFSISGDPDNYCALNVSASVVIAPNDTSYILTWNVQFGWNYTQGMIDVTNAIVYDVSNANGTNNQVGLFTFVANLSIQSIYSYPTSPQTASSFSMIGIVYYDGTTIAPPNGSITVYAMRDNVVGGGTDSIGIDGTFIITLVSPAVENTYTWKVFAEVNSVQNQSRDIYVHGATLPSGPVSIIGGPSISLNLWGALLSLGVIERGQTVSFSASFQWSGVNEINVNNVTFIGPTWISGTQSFPMKFYRGLDDNGNSTAFIPMTLYIPMDVSTGDSQITMTFDVSSGTTTAQVSCVTAFQIIIEAPQASPTYGVQVVVGALLAVALAAVLFTRTAKKKKHPV